MTDCPETCRKPAGNLHGQFTLLNTHQKSPRRFPEVSGQSVIDTDTDRRYTDQAALEQLSMPLIELPWSEWRIAQDTRSWRYFCLRSSNSWHTRSKNFDSSNLFPRMLEWEFEIIQTFWPTSFDWLTQKKFDIPSTLRTYSGHAFTLCFYSSE